MGGGLTTSPGLVLWLLYPIISPYEACTLRPVQYLPFIM
jgi:hypothetical protein